MIREHAVSPRRLLALLALAVTAVLGGAAPALAHDHLVSSDPADGAQLDASPDRITLTFSADVMDVSPAVRIVDANEATVLDATPVIDGTDAVVELEDPLPGGDYTVQWRVVSSDGHPIEGSFAIAVAGDASAATEPEASATAAATDEPETTASEEPAQEESSAPADAASEGASQDGEAGGDALVPVFIGLAAIVVIGVVIALRAGRSGRR